MGFCWVVLVPLLGTLASTTCREVRVRGRANLPSGESERLPEVIRTTELSATTFVDEEALKSRGVLLFRDLGLETPQDFSAFLETLRWPKLVLQGGGTVRSVLADGVRTASDEPATHAIEPHQDMAHNPRYPRKLAFFMLRNDCHDGGGETILTDMRAVTNQLRRDGVLDLFKDGGVTYKKILFSEEDVKQNSTFTWQRRLFAATKRDAEASLATLPPGTTSYRWTGADELHYEHTLPATVVHPDTGETLFFNGIHTNHRDYFDLAPHIDTSSGKSPYDTFFANGDTIDATLLDHIRGVWWNNSIAVPFRTGDVAIVDNILTGHGRMPWDPHKCTRKMLIAHLQGSS